MNNLYSNSCHCKNFYYELSIDVHQKLTNRHSNFSWMKSNFFALFSHFVNEFEHWRCDETSLLTITKIENRKAIKKSSSRYISKEEIFYEWNFHLNEVRWFAAGCLILRRRRKNNKFDRKSFRLWTKIINKFMIKSNETFTRWNFCCCFFFQTRFFFLIDIQYKNSCRRQVWKRAKLKLKDDTIAINSKYFLDFIHPGESVYDEKAFLLQQQRQQKKHFNEWKWTQSSSSQVSSTLLVSLCFASFDVIEASCCFPSSNPLHSAEKRWMKQRYWGELKKKMKIFSNFCSSFSLFFLFVRKWWNFCVNFKMLNEELRSKIKRWFKEARREIPLNSEGCGKIVKLKIFSKKRRKIVLTAMSKMQEFYELSMAIRLNITNCDQIKSWQNT